MKGILKKNFVLICRQKMTKNYVNCREKGNLISVKTKRMKMKQQDETFC